MERRCRVRNDSFQVANVAYRWLATSRLQRIFADTMRSCYFRHGMHILFDVRSRFMRRDRSVLIFGPYYWAYK